MNRVSRYLLPIFLFAIFFGCSDDGELPKDRFGHSSKNPTTNLAQNIDKEPEKIEEKINRDIKSVLVDTFVSGLPYVAIGEDRGVITEGTTDTNGFAEIPKGSVYIRYSFGSLVLGKVKANQVITPTNLFQYSNLDDKRVLFIVRLLLTLDEDRDASNGIQISSDIAQKVALFADQHNWTHFNKDRQEATNILNQLVEFLGFSTDRVVSQEEAKLHISNSMNRLEKETIIEKVQPNDICPDGGVKKVYRTDLSKDGNSLNQEYINYFCNSKGGDSGILYSKLDRGNDRCPDGGIKVHHYLGSSQFDEYRCNGDEVYKYNSFILYSIAPSNSNCQYPIRKEIQITKPNNIAVISGGTSYICADSDSNIELVQLVDSEYCPDGGVRVDYFGDSAKQQLMYSSYFCNQAIKDGIIPGKHNIEVVEANSSVCPEGGKEFRHSLDSDSNGELDTFYSEIECNKVSSRDLKSHSSIRVTKVLLNPQMSDYSKCPSGGYRLEKTIFQDGKIVAQWNDYNCSDIGSQVEDNISIHLLPASKYGTYVNKWCPNGGVKYIHKIYIDGVLKNTYYDINCSPLITFEQNETKYLNIGDPTCPHGGKIVIHKVIFNGDETNPSNYEYNTTHCNRVDTKNLIEKTQKVLINFGDSTCPYGGEQIIHKFYTKENKYLPDLDYTTTKCISLNFENLKEETHVVKTYQPGDPDSICPDGGVVKNHKYYIITKEGKKLYVPYIVKDGKKIYVPYWEFNTTHCNSIKYSDTIDIPEIIETNPEACPNGGKVVLHKRYTKLDRVHIPKWDYTETICNWSNHKETIDIFKIENLPVGNPVCPEGGKIVHHQIYDKYTNTHLSNLDYSETICNGLDFNRTVEKLEIINFEVGASPKCISSDGRFIQHYHYLDSDRNGKYSPYIDTVPIPQWDYNITQCNGIDYKETIEERDITKLDFGDEVCPYGGDKIVHKFYIVEDGVKQYLPQLEYSNIVCYGLDYNQTVERKISIPIPVKDKRCPYGGSFVQHQRYIDSNHNGIYDEESDLIHVNIWDYNVTECNGLDWNEIRDETVSLSTSGDICPGDGNITMHQIYFGNSHLENLDYKSIECQGSDWNLSNLKKVAVKVHNIGSEICPDGGVTYTYQRWLGDIHIEKWDYNVTECNGIDWNETIDKPITKILEYGDSRCPEGGKLIQHRRFADLDRDGEFETHIEKWDYNTTECRILDYNDTEEEIIKEPAPQNICSNGGNIEIHKRYVKNSSGEKRYINKFEYMSIKCNELRYSDTRDFPTIHLLEYGDSRCPEGGKLIQHQRWTIDKYGRKLEHIENWDYNSTYCDGVDYKNTVEKKIITTWQYGESEICPDGGIFIQHQRYIDSNRNGIYDSNDTIHIEKWDYNSTHCFDLKLSDTVEKNVTVSIWNFGDTDICPEGGRIIQHQRYIDSNKNGVYDSNDTIHVAKLDYNSTHCQWIDIADTLQVDTNQTLPVGNPLCPNGGILQNVIRYIDKNGNGQYDEGIDIHVSKFDQTLKYCSVDGKIDATNP
ncbi:MAG TPA: hypothetical protein EYO61_02565, partial [Campylobacterales bacterium]|nr:hypothetical protein [Campylobacterales bacterium]